MAELEVCPARVRRSCSQSQAGWAARCRSPRHSLEGHAGSQLVVECLVTGSQFTREQVRLEMPTPSEELNWFIMFLLQ